MARFYFTDSDGTRTQITKEDAAKIIQAAKEKESQRKSAQNEQLSAKAGN
ncbi:MAG: hypothetical protein AAB683_01195 [Patescibacteria group bacterium]